MTIEHQGLEAQTCIPVQKAIIYLTKIKYSMNNKKNENNENNEKQFNVAAR